MMPDLNVTNRIRAAAVGPWGDSPELAKYLSILRRPLLLYVLIIPNLLALLYFGLIASPVFVSRASLTVFNPSSNATSLAGMLSGGSGDSSSQGAYLLQDYVASWDEFRKIDQEFNLSLNYRDGDFVSAYGGLASGLREDDVALWGYYKRHVTVDIDVKSGIASITATGYRPDFTQKLAKAVLEDAVSHLTLMARQQRHDMILDIELRKTALEKAIRDDNSALAQYRAQVGTYDPKEQYVSDLSLLNSLISRKAELQSQYDSIRGATPNSPDVKNVSVAIGSMQDKISGAERQAAEAATASARYDALTARRDNDVTLLQQASLSALEAGQKVAQNRYYLNVISEPSAPKTPELPNRLYWIGGILVSTLLLWSLLR